MSQLQQPLDLSGLAQFRASSLGESPPSEQTLAAPMRIALELIDFDPAQPRRSLSEAALAELAASIAVHGVLEAVSLRRHPDAPGRYMLNRGERRVRASRLAGGRDVPAWLDERVDPFAQAAENLHREDMSPFDLAQFIGAREREGLSRAEIARRLSKSKSQITVAAALLHAPEEVRAAFDSGRVRDVRALYELTGALRRAPEQARALLASPARLGRVDFEQVRAAVPLNSDSPGPAPRRPAEPPAAGTALCLVVERDGRRGRLRWRRGVEPGVAEVLFDDGEAGVVPLTEIRLLCWR